MNFIQVQLLRYTITTNTNFIYFIHVHLKCYHINELAFIIEVILKIIIHIQFILIFMHYTTIIVLLLHWAHGIILSISIFYLRFDWLLSYAFRLSSDTQVLIHASIINVTKTQSVNLFSIKIIHTSVHVRVAFTEKIVQNTKKLVIHTVLLIHFVILMIVV